MEHKKTLCIIPARGGSKRIPRKNIKLFCGEPIISFSIKAAIDSSLFDEVMVSTDDKEISNIARECGAKVPFLRGSDNSNDFATTMDVIDEVLNSYLKVGITFEYICCLYPTAPFVTKEALDLGWNKLISGDVQTVVPVVEFSYPVWRGFNRNEDGQVNLIWPENVNKRSQDLPPVYHDAGQWYWLKTSAVGKPIFNKKTSSVVLSNLQVQDIDTLEDWAIAEIKYEQLQRS